MIILGKKIPTLLAELLTNGVIDRMNLSIMDSIFNIECSAPELYDIKSIVSETESVVKYNNETDPEFYIGENVNSIYPGKVDIKDIVLIGQTGYSEPIALHFLNKLNPNVIYFVNSNNKEYWVEVAASFEEFISFFRESI